MRPSPQQHRAAIYARVSTLDQEPENQLIQLRRYVEAREWTVTEYVDKGVSGAKDSRPALDTLVRDAKRREFDVLVCLRLDRLGRSLKHLVTLLDDLQALGVAFVSLGEGIDATTPAGKLQMHVLARAGLARRLGDEVAFVSAQPIKTRRFPGWRFRVPYLVTYKKVKGHVVIDGTTYAVGDHSTKFGMVVTANSPTVAITRAYREIDPSSFLTGMRTIYAYKAEALAEKTPARRRKS